MQVKEWSAPTENLNLNLKKKLTVDEKGYLKILDAVRSK